MRNPGYNDHQDCAVCSDSVSVCVCQTQHCTSPFRLVLTQPQMAVRSTGGFLWAHWQDLQVSHPLWFVGRLSDEFVKALRIRNTLMLLKSPGYCFHSPSMPSSCATHHFILDWVTKKWASLVAPCTAREAVILTHKLSLSLVAETAGRDVLSWH